MARLFLTDNFIYSCVCPQDKDQEIYWDFPKSLDGRIRRGAQKGLGLRVTAQGIKAFVHAYKFNGKRRRVVLGSPSHINVASARLLVHQREQQINSGDDPDADKVDYRKKHTLTVTDLVERYWERHVSGLSERTQGQYWRLIGGWLRPQRSATNRRGKNKMRDYVDFGTMFGDRAFEEIKPTDIERFLDQLSTPANWNTGLAYLKALFNWAIRMQIVDMRNPCTPIRQRKVIRERRDYSPEAIQAIAGHIFTPVLDTPGLTENLTGSDKRMAALANGRLRVQNDQMLELCNFMGILFLTMARPTELKSSHFSHFDLDRLIWHKHNTKGIKLSRALYEYTYRSVPIHPKVAELVNSQRTRWPNADLVFPSHTDPAKPRDNFRKPLERFKQLDGVPEHFQMYDLKRIAISLMLVGQGVRREDVSHYVDHKGNLETTMIYDLGFVDPLRPVTERLGQLLGV